MAWARASTAKPGFSHLQKGDSTSSEEYMTCSTTHNQVTVGAEEDSGKHFWELKDMKAHIPRHESSVLECEQGQGGGCRGGRGQGIKARAV